MKALIFEDQKWEDLIPLTYLHPVFELRCGKTSLLEKIVRRVGEMKVSLGVRKDIEELVRKKFDYPVNEESTLKDDVVLINGRWLMRKEDKLETEKEGIFLCGDNIVYVVVKKERIEKLWDGDFSAFLQSLRQKLPSKDIKVDIINYIWDFIHYNKDCLNEDFNIEGKRGIEANFPSQAAIVGSGTNVYVHPEAEIHPFVVLDATSGPIYIDKGAKIFPFTRIEGPSYIGKDTQIMPGSNIRVGSSFGPVCRIGGEVEETIFQGYTNKYHEGFLGHSFIGEWVNLGAITTNSDIKNDYSEVAIHHKGVPVKTGELKLGSFIADHTKTSIGCMLNTGTIAGVGCNITASGILPKYFPSFAWFINGKHMKGLGLEIFLETARKAMDRRGKKLILEEEKIIRKLYESTKEERLGYIKRSRKT